MRYVNQLGKSQISQSEHDSNLDLQLKSKILQDENGNWKMRTFLLGLEVERLNRVGLA